MDSIAIINGKEQSDISIFNRNFQYGDGPITILKITVKNTYI